MTEQTGDAGASSAASATNEPAMSRKESGATWLSWRRLLRWTKRVAAVATALPALVLVVWITGAILASTFRRHNLDLQPIAVPKVLADNGFSSDVVTRQMRDAVQNVHEQAGTTISKTDVELHSEETDITIPKAGIPVARVAALIRRLLPGNWQHDVSGEFTQSGSVLSMRLRLNERIIFMETGSGPDAPENLIKKGAYRLVEETEPYVAASWRYGKGDLPQADAAADSIIATLPAENESVARAYLLKGLIAEKRGQLDQAVAFYARAPNLSIAWFDLGTLRQRQNRDADAIAAYREAIRLDPTDASPHSGLGTVWYKQGKDGDAIAEFQTAIGLDPKDALPHSSLGTVWHKQGKDGDAIAEFQTAIRLDPKGAMPHNALGNVWRKQGKDDDAIAEFQTAIKLEPLYAASYYGLGIVSLGHANSETVLPRKAILLNEACRAFAEGSKRDPTDSDYLKRMHEIDGQLPGVHCSFAITAEPLHG